MYVLSQRQDRVNYPQEHFHQIVPRSVMPKTNYSGSDSWSWNQHWLLKSCRTELPSCLLQIIILRAVEVAETPAGAAYGWAALESSDPGKSVMVASFPPPPSQNTREKQFKKSERFILTRGFSPWLVCPITLGPWQERTSLCESRRGQSSPCWLRSKDQ